MRQVALERLVMSAAVRGSMRGSVRGRVGVRLSAAVRHETDECVWQTIYRQGFELRAVQGAAKSTAAHLLAIREEGDVHCRGPRIGIGARTWSAA